MRYFYQGTTKDGSGQVIVDAIISVYLAGTTTLASIYTSLTGISAVSSTTSGSATSPAPGYWSFYTDVFDHDVEQTFKIVISKSGFNPQTYDNVKGEVVLGTYTISTAKNATTHVVIPKGVLYAKSGSGSMAFNGPFEAGLYQVFSGFSAGDVTFGAGSIIESHAEWWGENTTPGTTDMYDEILSEIYSIPAAAIQTEMGGGRIIGFVPTIYLCNTGLINSARKVSLQGSSIDDTTLRKGANNIDLIKVDSFMAYQSIKDMTLDGNSKTGLSLLYLNTPNYVNLENLNLKNSLSTISALYLNLATVTTLRNIHLNDNVKTAYFNQINASNIYNMHIAGVTGALANDVEFYLATDTSIFGLSLSGDTGLRISYCSNFNINGLYLETPLTVPAVTIGHTGQPSKVVSINGVNATVTAAGVHTGPLIRALYVSLGVTIKNVFITQTGAAVYAGGWIELGDVRGVLIENVLAQSVSAAGVSAVNLIFSSGVGPTDVVLRNIFSRDDENTGTIDLLATNLVIENCNMPITIQAGSTNVTLINCTGTITDNTTGGQITRINTGGTDLPIKTLADSATPSVAGGNRFLTGGTTTITNFTDGYTGKKIEIISEHAITITDGTNIFLSGSANFVMAATDTLTLIQKADGKWYETGRSDNT